MIRSVSLNWVTFRAATRGSFFDRQVVAEVNDFVPGFVTGDEGFYVAIER